MLAKTTTLKDITKLLKGLGLGIFALTGKSGPSQNVFIWNTSKFETAKELNS
jgi:hypothetical protein